MFLGFTKKTNTVIPEQHRKTPQGVMINYPVKDVQKMYDHLYQEGLTLLNEPENAPCGRKHFMVEDPNGILIDVAEDLDIALTETPRVSKTTVSA